MSKHRASVFTIPPERAFADAFASGLLADAKGNPEALARMTLLLPTRRACRALAEAFLRQSEGRPLLLPRLMPLGDVDEDALVLGGDLPVGNGEDAFSIPPAISGLRRQMLLTRLILARDGDATTPDQAARLALELGRLLDQVQTERLDFGALADLVPRDYAEHWQETLAFLTILTELWPKVLDEEGAVDAAKRRDLLITRQAETWAKNPPADPVIAAGSTGSIPATADLLKVVANLPRGVVVLPGLDLDVALSWRDALEPSHPQYGLYRLLDHLGVAPEDVAPWRNEATPRADTASARRALINRALAPAEATARWREEETPDPSALDGVSLIECPGAEEEAGTIALILRHTLEEDGKTAALITPDRGLARRVAADMKRWGVDVDDSAGTPLAQTPPGAFLRLTARMAETDFDPISTLACLKHPLAAGGMAPAHFRRAVRTLERHVLRGPRPGAGVGGLIHALGLWTDREKNKTPGRRNDDAIADVNTVLRPALDRLDAAAKDFTKLLNGKKVAFMDLLQAHVRFTETLTITSGDAPAHLWAGEAGEALAGLVAELTDGDGVLDAMDGRGYAALLDQFMTGRVVRPRFGRSPRVSIWGLLEARLQHADVMVLGGLNEGTWPPEAPASPWMSRPMLARFGLPQPERRIGLAAHDFTQAFAAPEVYLTRALRVEGTPTVAARWLVRLEKYLSGPAGGIEALRARGNQWLHWQGELDRARTFTPAAPPAPAPPMDARPRHLSVTQIETWMRDPYGVYARHILGLRALDPLDADPSAADYGTFIHDALDAFAKNHPHVLPDQALEKLLALGEKRFAAFMDRPGVWAFWWPRFERIARWFIDEETKRRDGTTQIFSEVTGTLTLDAPGGAFTLTAKADRIEQRADGTLTLVDYKTGTPPSTREVHAGFSPQLPLEAAIALAGGFDGVTGQGVGMLEYWRLGGGVPAGEIKSPLGRGKDATDPETLAGNALDGLRALVALFDLPATTYPARPRPEFAPRYSDYEHLARVREWASQSGDGE